MSTAIAEVKRKRACVRVRILCYFGSLERSEACAERLPTQCEQILLEVEVRLGSGIKVCRLPPKSSGGLDNLRGIWKGQHKGSCLQKKYSVLAKTLWQLSWNGVEQRVQGEADE